MRLYSFALHQLKPLHQGVQNLHSAVELFVKYNDAKQPQAMYDMLMDWARDHKTAIFLDGGFAVTMKELFAALEISPYPWTAFHEDEETLYGVMTSISMVLPAKVYEAAEFIRGGGALIPSASGKVFFNNHVLTMWDLAFVDVLNKFRMAV